MDESVSIRVRDDFQLAGVAAFRDCVAALTGRAKSVLGLALRDGPVRSAGAGGDALGIGPRRWILLRFGADGSFATDVARNFAGLAAVCDQSDGYVLFEASGEGARSALAKQVPIDLHPMAFTVSDVAVTTVGHVNVILWLREPVGLEAASLRTAGSGRRFCLAVPRSYARSFEDLLRGLET